MNLNRCYSLYLETVFEPDLFKRSVNDIVNILKTIQYDAIVFRGNSGALMSGALSLRTGKPMVMVRKRGENNHSGMNTEGYQMVEKFVIIDDLISSGGTICSIWNDLISSRQNINSQAPLPKVVAIILYNEYNDYDSGLKDDCFCLDNNTRSNLSDVPIYTFKYIKVCQTKTKIKFYCNKLVRNALGVPEPESDCDYIYR